MSRPAGIHIDQELVMDPTLLTGTGVDLWRDLQEAFGLQPEGYDSDLVDEVGRVLGLPPGDIDRALAENKVTVEQLLHAVLAALGPFAGMLTDLLWLYEQAAASCADSPNLLVRYDFGKKQPPLRFDLESFKGWVAVSRGARTDKLAREWGPDGLWNIVHTLETADPDDHSTDRLAPSWADDWLDTYKSGAWPADAPALPTTGHAELDARLLDLRSVMATVLDRCRELSTDREDLQERRQVRSSNRADDVTDDDEYDIAMLGHLESDRWLESAAVELTRTVERCRTDTNADVAGLVVEISRLIDQVPVRTVEQLTTSLLAVLSLPAWRRRHELYSAWVLTQIVKAAGPKSTTMHPSREGKLSFSFKGSHVATIQTPAHGPVFVWAELRSPVTAPKGKSRKAGIQPDYTLLLPPINEAASALAVVECKQYRKANAKNFSEALADYADGRPSARVILVNYGPAPGTILGRVTATHRHRCALVARLRPDDLAQKQEFARYLRQSLRLPLGPTRAEARPNPGTDVDEEQAWATVRLDWLDSPRDLDLHVIGQTTDVSAETDGQWSVEFNHQGDLTTYPFAMLDRDVTTGRGPETITVMNPAQLEVLVHRYSDDGTLGSSGARVHVRTPAAEVSLACPPDLPPDARTWRAGMVRADGTVWTPIEDRFGK